MWKHRRTLPGQRCASRGFADFMENILVHKLGFAQCPAEPCFFHRDSDDTDVELHQDDLHATSAEDNSLLGFVDQIREHAVFKASPLLKSGCRYEFLKAGRVRTCVGTYFVGNPQVCSSYLQGARP